MQLISDLLWYRQRQVGRGLGVQRVQLGVEGVLLVRLGDCIVWQDEAAGPAAGSARCQPVLVLAVQALQTAEPQAG